MICKYKWGQKVRFPFRDTMKEGYIEIQMTSAPKMTLDLTTEDKTVEDIFTFNDVKKAYQNNDYTEAIDITLNWHMADGSIVPLGTHNITFKRNKMSTIQITMDSDDADSQIGLEIDDEPMSEDDEVTNIEDGEIVDTNVEAK